MSLITKLLCTVYLSTIFHLTVVDPDQGHSLVCLSDSVSLISLFTQPTAQTSLKTQKNTHWMQLLLSHNILYYFNVNFHAGIEIFMHHMMILNHFICPSI